MQDLIHYRKFNDVPDETGWTANEYEGVDGFYWLISDSGAWTGPLKNWREDSAEFMSQVKNFDVVICAGGNCGMYPRFYGNYFQEVYTWEPCPDNFACLDMNCVGTKYHKVLGGLGSTRGKANLLTRNKKNVGTHKVVADENGDTDLYTIDDLNLQKCDLIHLDVEGFEKEVLEGAKETIKKYHPIIITERAKGRHLLIELGYTEFKKLSMDTIYIYEGNS